MKIGAIVLRCGDSRNGSVEKALRKKYEWPDNTRIKTIAVAGGAHACGQEINHAFVLSQVKIYSSVLEKNVGANEIYIIITDHNDCGYTKTFGEKDIISYWTSGIFIANTYIISGAIAGVKIVNVDYHDSKKSKVPSQEIQLEEVWAGVRRLPKKPIIRSKLYMR